MSIAAKLLSGAALLVSAVLLAEPGPQPNPVGVNPPPPGPREGKKFRRRPRPPKAFFSKLTEAERSQLDLLARSGKKEELRKFMREMFFKYRPEETKQLDALSERYLKSNDEKERAAIRAEMEKLSRILFRKRQEFTRNNIAETERQLARAQKDLQRLKQRYQSSEENADKIIAGHVEQMCLPPEQRRKFNRRPPDRLPRKQEAPPAGK